MRLARVTVAVKEDTVLRPEAWVDINREPVAWLEVGDTEVGLFGSPAALRRLALDAVRAAEYAEELGGDVFVARRELAAR